MKAWTHNRPRHPRGRSMAYVVDAQHDTLASHPIPEPIARRMAEHLTKLTRRPFVVRLT